MKHRLFCVVASLGVSLCIVGCRTSRASAVDTILASVVDASSQSAEAHRAAQNLSELGEGSVDEIIAHLADPEPVVKFVCVSALAASPRFEKSVTCVALNEAANRRIRSGCVLSIGMSHYISRDASLARLITDGDTLIRKAAISSSGRGKREVLVPPLLASLRSSDGAVVALAIISLRTHGGNDVAAAIACALSSTSTDVEREAAYALSVLHADEFSDQIAKLLASPDEQVARAAWNSLCDMHTATANRACAEAVSRLDPGRAAMLIGLIDQSDTGIVERLREALRTRNEPQIVKSLNKKREQILKTAPDETRN